MVGRAGSHGALQALVLRVTSRLRWPRQMRTWPVAGPAAAGCRRTGWRVVATRGGAAAPGPRGLELRPKAIDATRHDLLILYWYLFNSETTGNRA